MYGAQEVTPDNTQFRSYYRMVKELAENAQLPMPKVYVINEQQPNAFATGRNPENAAVAATVGIMQILNERELRGVMAHELAHVKHRDTLISTISATVAGAISAIAQFGMFFGRGGERSNPIIGLLMMFLAPMAAGLIQMAISRAREYEADRGGAEICRDPKALASALEKIHNYAHQIPNQTAEMHPETGQMMIINPLSGKNLKGLFSTHPQTEERVRRLLSMANQY
jgi:heat shock protein HtpX